MKNNCDDYIKDITETKANMLCGPDNTDEELLNRLKNATDARIGIGRAGTRCKTISYLRFRADCAAAHDAVMLEVEESVPESIGMFEVKTKCNSKYDMLTRPDLGRLFDDETKEYISAHCRHNADIQIYCGDGLSAPSVAANVCDMIEMIKTATESENISIGTPFFVRYCRVNTAREIAPLLGAKVICVLIGERPGLSGSESMSAYIAYNARPDMSESDYTVISNIGKKGMPPVEAGAYAAEIMMKMLSQKASGLALKL